MPSIKKVRVKTKDTVYSISMDANLCSLTKMQGLKKAEKRGPSNLLFNGKPKKIKVEETEKPSLAPSPVLSCSSMIPSKTKHKVVVKREAVDQRKNGIKIKVEEQEHYAATDERKNTTSGTFQLVFGGRVFHEDVRLLSCSKVLNKQIHQGYHRFARYTRDPNEWKVVRELLDPFSGTSITEDNLEMALSWFAFLQIHHGISRCDDILASSGISLPLKRSKYSNDLLMASTDLTEVLDSLELAVQYDLPKSKEKCFEIVRQVLAEAPHWLDEDPIAKVVALVNNDSECEAELLSTLKGFIPTGNSTLPMPEMLGNPLFPMLVLSGVEGKRRCNDKINQMQRILDKIIGIIGNAKPHTHIKSIKKEIQKDRGCRKMVPKKW